MDNDAGQKHSGGHIRVLAAWASLLIGIAAYAIFLGCIEMVNSYILLFFGALALLSACGGIAGLFSLFGIRSRWKASLIIPGALMGICFNGYVAFWTAVGLLLSGNKMGHG